MFRCYLMSQTCMFSWGLHRDTDSIRQAQPESVQIDGPWWASANNEKGTWTLRMFMELLGLPISDQMHIRQNKTCNHPKNWIVFFRWFLDYNHYVSDSDMSRFPTLSITNIQLILFWISLRVHCRMLQMNLQKMVNLVSLLSYSVYDHSYHSYSHHFYHLRHLNTPVHHPQPPSPVVPRNRQLPRPQTDFPR